MYGRPFNLTKAIPSTKLSDSEPANVDLTKEPEEKEDIESLRQQIEELKYQLQSATEGLVTDLLQIRFRL